MSALDKLMRKPTAKLTHIEYAIKQSYSYGSKTIAETAADDLANIDAELAALRERVRVLEKFFNEVEWCGDQNAHVCPDCGNRRSQGHRPSCRYRTLRDEVLKA